MNRYYFIILMMLLPILAIAQVAGGQVTRPTKKQQVTKKVQTAERQTKVKQSEQNSLEATGYDITISCNVPSATILIDGNKSGKANDSWFLKTGSHSIKLTADGYEPLSQTIYVNSISRSFSFTMKKSSPQKPSATIGDISIGVLSDGDIICKIDDIMIKGAKGEVEVRVLFENKENGISDVVKKKVTPPYESTHYKSLRIWGNISDLTTLKNNRGNFEVYAMILINPIKEGDSMTYEGGGESKARNVTIYYQGGWNSKGGGLGEGK